MKTSKMVWPEDGRTYESYEYSTITTNAETPEEAIKNIKSGKYEYRKIFRSILVKEQNVTNHKR